MPLYFIGSCTSPFLFHIGNLPSCIHTFSSLPVHLTPNCPAISTISSRTSSAPVALPFSSRALLSPPLPVLSPPLPLLSYPSSGARGNLLLILRSVAPCSMPPISSTLPYFLWSASRSYPWSPRLSSRPSHPQFYPVPSWLSYFYRIPPSPPLPSPPLPSTILGFCFSVYLLSPTFYHTAPP